MRPPNIDWEAIFWETRGYLGLEDDEPVPREELLETAKANGWSESEFRQSLTATDDVEFSNGVGSGLQFVGRDSDSEDQTDDVDEPPVPTETSEETQSVEQPDDVDVDHSDLEWSVSRSGELPQVLEDLDAWMPTQGKLPFAPYAKTENQWSWSDPDNWTDVDTAQKWRRMHPQLTGLAFILQSEEGNYNGEPDPVLFVDYDDVIDEETGQPCEEALELMDRLGLTYTDLSTSETGAHQLFRGKLPEGTRTIQFDLPNDAGEVEIYDRRRVTVMTGKRIPGTPEDIQPVDEDVLEELADEHGRTRSTSTTREDWEPEFDRDDLEDLDETSNIQAIFDAVQQTEPRDIRLRSKKTEKRPDGTLSFDPAWETSDSGKRLGWDPDIGFIYRKGDRGLDALHVVALEDGISRSVSDYPTGEDWWRAVDALRDRGARIPEYDPPEEDSYKGSGDGRAVSALPIAQLDALEPAERRRYARKRGLEWPSTDDAREQLFDTIAEAMRNEDDRVVDAPTSLGKSFTTASTRWGARKEITGDRPVVHLLQTRDARDEAIDVAEEEGGTYHVLLGRHEACPVAAGEFDDEITIAGEAASDWLDRQCDGKSMPFSAAHRHLEEHNDQNTTLPCSDDCQCEAIAQWDKYREGPDGGLDYWPLVIATHNFAYAPGLRMHNNVVVDEEPAFEQELSTDRIRRAVGAYLREIDAPVSTWESFIQLSLNEQYGTDAAAERDALEDALYQDPDQDWYFEERDAHTLAPALARAIFRAEDRANGRRFGKTMHEPPRLEAGVRDDDEWNREWVSVVLDETNDVRSVRVVPDFGAARSVIGLDAHPAVPLWQANTLPWIKTKQVLDPEARQLWRRYERGLRVVQVGDATRPLSGDKALEWLNEDKLEVLFEHLVDEYGTQFRTAITTAQVEDRLEELMEEAGVHRPELMHFGEEKSRNDFANERVGLVNGCMDPGDDYVIDILAELDLDAEVETDVDDQGEEYRARGRGFTGADADTAGEILASVRENHIAQAAGRYARSPTDPDVNATVFVRTDAMPVGFADVQTPGVEWVFTDLQEEIVEDLRSSRRSRTTKEISESVGCSKEHVRTTLKRLSENEFGTPAVQVSEGTGANGATLYSDSGLPTVGLVDLHESPTDPYGSSSRWALAIRDPADRGDVSPGGDDASSSDTAPVWDWRSPPDQGD
ncbi:hypothetical protein [Natronoglomus mannanivorans]|uniref:Bifunctional DNA primase/polymerase, N-terminal n=1 Tax=Natronoglomus mannanivorans TaxID=2979990 RepID=A0AAP3E3V8_9EURY|nr:hypothetical protein [Halobacteria archaeon AArc-xg1-1]